MTPGVDSYGAGWARTAAIRSASGDDYAAVMASIYVGDQLARIADLLEDRARRAEAQP